MPLFAFVRLLREPATVSPISLTTCFFFISSVILLIFTSWLYNSVAEFTEASKALAGLLAAISSTCFLVSLALSAISPSSFLASFKGFWAFVKVS